MKSLAFVGSYDPDVCGRYSLDARPEEIVEAFDLLDRVAFERRYNVAPTQIVPIVRLDRDTQTRRLDLIRWGLTPSWWNGPRPLINARSESVATRPAFRRAFESQRCLVPATGFYEWQTLAGAKQPFHIHPLEGRLMVFAGIWDLSRDADGNMVESFAILTTAPNKVLEPLHDRMPVILAAPAFETWLDPAPASLDALQELCAPAPDDRMTASPVSRLVNNTANDEPACMTPLAGAETSDGQAEFNW